MKTSEYIEMMMKNRKSEAELARKLGVSRQTINKYKNNEARFGADTIIKISKLTRIPEHKIASDMYAQRSKDPKVKKRWQEIADTLCVVGLATSAALPQAGKQVMYIMLN